jgi:hypothetical protein
MSMPCFANALRTSGGAQGLGDWGIKPRYDGEGVPPGHITQIQAAI